MLIAFSVANYRSIHSEQTLSLMASADKTHPGHVHEPDLRPRGLRDLRLLKAALIYGHNASGKSNVLKALGALRSQVVNSADLKPGDQIPREPFCLGAEGKTEPTSFYIAFLHEGARYDYALSFDGEQVIEETLQVNNKGATKTWLDRKGQTILLGSEVEAAETHRESTKRNVLFLSWAAQNNDPNFSKVYLWFKRHLTFYNASGLAMVIEHPSAQATLGRAAKDESFRTRLLDLLSAADVGIVDMSIQAQAEEDPVSQHIKELFTEKFIKLMAESRMSMHSVQFIHRAGESRAPLEFRLESDGTKQLIALAEPLFQALDDGSVVVVDEFESHLHPTLVRKIFQFFNDPILNPKGAQLIVATHLLELLDQDLIRRDQVYFTEKSTEGTTRLYPLLDYRVRKGEALSKGYLAGRYGAIPRIRMLASPEPAGPEIASPQVGDEHGR